MTNRRRTALLCRCGLAAGLAVATSSATELMVTSVTPAARTLDGPVQGPIVIRFDRAVDRTTIEGGEHFWAFGRWSGTAAGSLSYADGDKTVTLTPDRRFSAGESVMVILSHHLLAADGSPLRPAGYSYQFWTAARPTPMTFAEVDRLTTRTTPSVSTRAYGGIASDVDGDGFLDLTIVNEDTADLRVLLNRADGSGTFDAVLQPTFAVGDRASPSEPADFNRDGQVDICVANINANTVSVLLGNGDGTFGPQQFIPVGLAPRGIAVLDADGDGDVDIVNTNSDSDNLSLMLNDGTGLFGAPAFFEGGGGAEWALAAADMNNDGVLDLVVGARDSQTVVVNLNDGDGTFTPVSSQSSAGAVWMLVCGDLNGDGAEDLTVANSSTDNGTVLFGDGTGQLSAPQTYPTDPFTLATDLGDLDGDGDLDWLNASFSLPHRWFLYRNDGAGAFTLEDTFTAPRAASCSLMLDVDNDLDLDLALIDELQDEVIILQNSGFTPPPVPAVSAWAMLVMALGSLTAGTVILRRRTSFTRSRCPPCRRSIPRPGGPT